MRLTWLPDVLRAAGLDVRTEPGWETRGSGDFSPFGIICHATAGSPNSTDAGEIRVLINGSKTAPPPIAQLYLSRSGRITVVASGRCNHALTGRAGPLKGHGNSSLIGIEAQNDNRGQPWPAVQVDAYVRMVAAICRRMGWTEQRVSAHREHQPGQKTDPHGINMNDFRARVKALLTKKGNGMLTADQDRKLHDIWFQTANRGVPPNTGGPVDYILRMQAAMTEGFASVLTAIATEDIDTESIKRAITETSEREVRQYGQMLDERLTDLAATLAEAITAELDGQVAAPVLQAAMDAALRNVAARVAGSPAGVTGE